MESFMPHGYCLSWNPQLVLLFVIGNSLITLAYYSIPAALAVIFIKRRDLVFNWMFMLFAAFILACGTTHLIKIWTIWHASYWLEALVDAATGVLSLITAVLLWNLVPKVLALPSLKQLMAANNALSEQITQRNKAEQKFRGLLESAPDAVVIINRNGEMEIVNLQTEKLFGYSREELLGKKVEMLIPERYRENHPDKRNSFFALPRLRLIGSELTLTAVRKDGSEFPVEISLSPIETEEGLLVSSAIRDISERRKMMQQLKDQKEELTASNSELQRFAYVAAHDLREPLRTIVSYTDLLSQEFKGKLSPDAHENMGFIVDAGKRMQQMISDLLTYSRVETQKQALTPTDCNKVIDQTIASLKISIEEAGGQVSHDLMPTVIADASQLSQLFLNLIGNALKFRGKEPPKIHISAKQEGDEWLFSIDDNGIGIDIDFADRVFQMFQRLHGMSEYPGTGIGLAVCRKIVERHRGRIWFESKKDQAGTIFYFTLPANQTIV